MRIAGVGAGNHPERSALMGNLSRWLTSLGMSVVPARRNLCYKEIVVLFVQSLKVDVCTTRSTPAVRAYTYRTGVSEACRSSNVVLCKVVPYVCQTTTPPPSSSITSQREFASLPRWWTAVLAVASALHDCLWDPFSLTPLYTFYGCRVTDCTVIPYRIMDSTITRHEFRHTATCCLSITLTGRLVVSTALFFSPIVLGICPSPTSFVHLP